MLKLDSGNNSVWSYRYFILNKAPTGLFKDEAPGTVGFVRSEVEIILNDWLPKNLANEPVWVYMRGMLCQSEEDAVKSQNKNVKKVCITHVKDILLPFLNQAVSTLEVKPNKSGLRFVLMTLVDVLLASGEADEIE